MILKDLISFYIEEKNLNNLFLEVIDRPVLGIETNSQKIKNGYIFIAIKGDKIDGNNFINDAIDNGAICIFSDSAKKEYFIDSIPIFPVSEPREFVGKICSRFFGYPQKNIKIIGITGTNGKTSTISILKNIFEASGKKTLQVGTLGLVPKILDDYNGLTTPDTVEAYKILNKAVENAYEYVLFEVSSHALVQNRLSNIKFRIASFTNISRDHLDFHKTFEDYFLAKSKIFHSIDLNGKKLINIDCMYGQRLNEIEEESLTLSTSGRNADFACIDYKVSMEGIFANFRFFDKEFSISSSLIGKIYIENILTASAIAFLSGCSFFEIIKGVKEITSINGRLDRVENIPNDIFLDYGHSPAALEATLSSIKEISEKKIKVLFGAGGNRDKTKRSFMAKSVEKYADFIYLAPDNPREEKIQDINQQVALGFKKNNHKIFLDRGDALKEALLDLNTEDVLIIFGKGNETYQEVLGEKQYYSDKEIILEFYENRN